MLVLLTSHWLAMAGLSIQFGPAYLFSSLVDSMDFWDGPDDVILASLNDVAAETGM
jgi:hypothetical protein